MFALLLTKLDLALRLHAAFPTVGVVEAYANASAAVEASTALVPADLLVAVAYIESRFDPTATSRVVGARRMTGSYPSLEPPRGLNGTLYCGELQTFAASWSECIAMRDRTRAYAAGAAELGTWMRDKRVRGDLELALAGHGCGNAGVATRSCNNYPARVQAVRYFIRRSVPKRVSSVRRAACGRSIVLQMRRTAKASVA
jgi:hypothetical protein